MPPRSVPARSKCHVEPPTDPADGDGSQSGGWREAQHNFLIDFRISQYLRSEKHRVILNACVNGQNLQPSSRECDGIGTIVLPRLL